jgi:hypothetical protein
LSALITSITYITSITQAMSTERLPSSYVITASQLTKRAVVALADTFRAACLSGSAASLTSTIALAVCGKRENGSAAGPINGPSQWLWGEAEAYTSQPTWRHTAAGYVIHHAMSVLWAATYESLGRSGERVSATRICAQAAFVTSLAYCVDYHLAPRRLRPGFKKHLGPRSIFSVYAAFAAGLALSSLLRSRERERAYARSRPTSRNS